MSLSTEEIKDRSERLHASTPTGIVGHRKDKCDVCALVNEISALRDVAVDCLLNCPECGEPHIDAPQLEKNWTNPPHRTHECQYCHIRWRPYEVATNGIENPIIKYVFKA